MKTLFLKSVRYAYWGLSIFWLSACAHETDMGDVHLPGGILEPAVRMSKVSSNNYTVLDATQYQKQVQDARYKIQQLIDAIQADPNRSADERIAFIAQQFADVPYLFTGAMGEGDWKASSSVYQPGAVHVKQDPVYRLDGLDCQTFVQVAMGLLYSRSLNEFDQHIVKIAYGAAGNPLGEIVRYYNRNNFVDGDWNPINQRQGYLADVTSKGKLASYAETVPVNITRQNWFLLQLQNPAVRVLHDADGAAMVNRFMTTYSSLAYPRFDTEQIFTSYLPKEKLALQQTVGNYQPNLELLDKIPTPAVIEIVRDPKRWTIGGKSIKDVIGSELSISHMGLLYRHRFQYGELIYRKTACDYDAQGQRVCAVTPVTCQQAQCNELMFLHATDARPRGYYWYQQADGSYICSAKLPTNAEKYTQCNRVQQQPLFNYLTEYQYGNYVYMNSPSIVGIHIEKLL